MSKPAEPEPAEEEEPAPQQEEEPPVEEEIEDLEPEIKEVKAPKEGRILLHLIILMDICFFPWMDQK